MSRKFFLFLVVAFLLQLSWGVASAYCMHETGKASQHFGHHQHQHQPASAADDDGAKPIPKKAAFHADCAACAHGSLAAPMQQVAALPPATILHQTTTTVTALPAPYLGLPERPQWQRAA